MIILCMCVCVGTCAHGCTCVGQGNLGCCSSGAIFEIGSFIGLELAMEARLTSWYILGICLFISIKLGLQDCLLIYYMCVCVCGHMHAMVHV